MTLIFNRRRPDPTFDLVQEIEAYEPSPYEAELLKLQARRSEVVEALAYHDRTEKTWRHVLRWSHAEACERTAQNIPWDEWCEQATHDRWSSPAQFEAEALWAEKGEIDRRLAEAETMGVLPTGQRP